MALREVMPASPDQQIIIPIDGLIADQGTLNIVTWKVLYRDQRMRDALLDLLNLYSKYVGEDLTTKLLYMLWEEDSESTSLWSLSDPIAGIAESPILYLCHKTVELTHKAPQEDVEKVKKLATYIRLEMLGQAKDYSEKLAYIKEY